MFAADDDASSVAAAAADTLCAWCRLPRPVGKRADSIYCDRRCRQAAWRFRREITTAAVTVRPMRFAYADPPYPGNSARYYAGHPDYAGEVDHASLVHRLVNDYPDGWALSTSSAALRHVLALVPAEVRVRIGAWTRPPRFGRTRHPVAAWEPVVFAGGRPLDADERLADWLHAAPMRRYPGQVIGTKPPAFCSWLFASLGARRGDELHDLFPGSGAVGRAWAVYTSSVTGDARHL